MACANGVGDWQSRLRALQIAPFSRAQCFSFEELWPRPNSDFMMRVLRERSFDNRGFVSMRDMGYHALGNTIGEVIGTTTLLCVSRLADTSYCGLWCGCGLSGAGWSKFYYGR